MIYERITLKRINTKKNLLLKVGYHTSITKIHIQLPFLDNTRSEANQIQGNLYNGFLEYTQELSFPMNA